jgi:hypothetical protein
MEGTTTRVHSVTVAATGSVTLTATYCPQTGCGGAAASSSSILVNSQYSPSGTLIGMYVILASGGVTVATGFTPAFFSTTSGRAYTVSVYDYSNSYFDYSNAYFFQWSTGATARTVSVTASSSQTVLTASYCATQGGCGGGSTGSSISVGSQYMGGVALTGMYTIIQQGGATIASGFTPVTFATTSGASYSVTVSDDANTNFSQWSNGVTTRTIAVLASSSQTALTAVFCKTAGCASGGGGGGGGGSGNTITVTSSDLHSGATITGVYVDLRLNDNHVQSGFTPVTFSGLQTGVQYLAVVYWYGDYYFRHFSNGNLQRYSLVTLNTTAGQTTYSMNALYEAVPSTQAASLNIIAQFPNGTQIGTASEIGGYPQHTPGMYLSVIPPGSGTPFTATFTGGSILPFVFFNGQTYTVDMSAGYNKIHFDHWKDNGSTDPNRSFSLAGDSSYIAVYVET